MSVNHAIDKQPIILAGHRDSHMQFMSELNIGDKIELMMSDGVLKTYIISGTEVSDKTEVALSPVTLGRESLILTTCWPFNAIKSGDQRYLIFADKVNVSASIDNAWVCIVALWLGVIKHMLNWTLVMLILSLDKFKLPLEANDQLA